MQIVPNVMDVLVYQPSHLGEVCPEETVIKAGWPDTFASDDLLVHSISELRMASLHWS